MPVLRIEQYGYFISLKHFLLGLGVITVAVFLVTKFATKSK